MPIRALLVAATLLASALPVRAASLVLVELFTSQACSSCPPADALLARLAAADPSILALDMHVTYWDGPGWRDPFSLAAATNRQRAYRRTLGLSEIYTPQLVAGGRAQAIGSDAIAVGAAIATARAATHISPVLRLTRAGSTIRLRLGAAKGTGRLILVGFDPAHVTRVRGGENGGRTLREIDVVRSIATVATWTGAPLSLDVPHPAGQRAAAFVQAPDGTVTSAAVLAP